MIGVSKSTGHHSLTPRSPVELSFEYSPSRFDAGGTFAVTRETFRASPRWTECAAEVLSLLEAGKL